MKFVLMNQAERLAELGRRIRDERTRKNITRQAMADKSGVPYGTLRTLESTGEGSMKNYLAVMHALGMALNFDQFMPKPELRPTEIIALLKRKRKRARSTTSLDVRPSNADNFELAGKNFGGYCSFL